MSQLDRIKSALQKHKRKIKEKYKVKEIGVFGSYVRGEQKKGSDIDILVEFSRIPGLFKYLELEGYLSRLIGTQVDLVHKSALKPLIGKHVLSEVIYL